MAEDSDTYENGDSEENEDKLEFNNETKANEMVYLVVSGWQPSCQKHFPLKYPTKSLTSNKVFPSAFTHVFKELEIELEVGSLELCAFVVSFVHSRVPLVF